jgi:hypothetical protein
MAAVADPGVPPGCAACAGTVSANTSSAPTEIPNLQKEQALQILSSFSSEITGVLH